MIIAIIAAVAPDGTIGHEGRIPWHLSDDLKRFKRLTMGHAVIMGRKTYASLGKPLPGRRNLVLTHNTQFHADGVTTYANLDAAIAACKKAGETTAFIIGGAEVYRQALAQADTLLLTHVHKQITGDTKFPPYDRSQWIETVREDKADCSFVEYTRR
ncbi:MAG: dihydrofolate reductase [Verrucomicrobiia bacterium]